MGKRNHFIEIGRVVVLNYGPDAGKLATIVDILDQSRALVDGPEHVTGVKRQTIPLRNLSLTPINVPKLGRGSRAGTLARKLAAAKVVETYGKSSWAKKAARTQVRENLSDFDRFNLMILKKKKSSLISREVGKLKRIASGRPVKKPAAKTAKK